MLEVMDSNSPLFSLGRRGCKLDWKVDSSLLLLLMLLLLAEKLDGKVGKADFQTQTQTGFLLLL